jgi:tetratricopeptide (TPR) repeat protein
MIITAVRILIALIVLFGCYRLATESARNGYARLCLTAAIIQSQVEPADYAAKLSPTDPEVHYTLGLTLANHDKLQEAAGELRQAVQLRPHHYYQWLDLGLTLDQLDDQQGALSAFNKSIQLAPTFTQPRWQLGSLLYRQGKYDQAFAELRAGASSNRAFFLTLMDLAWAASGGDVSTMERLVDPRDPSGHLSLADYLAKHGKGSDAVRQVRLAKEPGQDADQSILRDTITSLLQSKQYVEARDVWLTTHPDEGSKATGSILNGDFIEPIAQNDPGFGWQLSETPNVTVSKDQTGPVQGVQAIFLSFAGEVDPGAKLLYQYVLVRPKTRYLLTFTTRTQELVSGGPAILRIYDGADGRVLGESRISTGSNDWAKGEIDFSTGDTASAIIVSLQRLNCDQPPCPIFGKLWLSRLALSIRQ